VNRLVFGLISISFIFGSFAFAKQDGSDIPACKGVTDVCMAANVSATDSKTGKAVQGYQPGEHKRDGEGLWVDCVHKLAKGETVAGVTGVSAAAAKACAVAERAAHPRKKH
jgi:hypothetical protein